MWWKQCTLAVLAASVLLTCTAGCTGSRWLSRKDYSEMSDPFLPVPQLAAGAPAARDGSSGGDGVVRLGQPPRDSNAGSLAGITAVGSAAGSAEQRAGVAYLGRAAATERPAGDGSASPRGPKPIQTASGSAVSPGYVTPAQARYPDAVSDTAESKAAASGPSLADFMTPESAARPQSAVAANTSIARPSAAAESGNRTSSARPAAGTSQLSEADVAAFQQFVQASSGSDTGNTHRQAFTRADPGQTMPDPASSTNPFASTELAAQTPPAGQSTQSAVALDARHVSPGPPFDSFTADPISTGAPQRGLAALTNGAASDEVARPLAATAVAPPAASSTPEENPFGPAEQMASGRPTESNQQATLDNSFILDSGWKPSHFVHP